MPLPLLAIGFGIMAAAGAAKSIVGASQAAKAKRLAAQNQRPDFEISPEYYQNQALAQSMAQTGLPESSLQYYTSNLERGLSGTNSAALQAGGGPNAIASGFDSYRMGLGEVAARDAEMKNANIRYLIDRNRDIAEQRTMQWSLNKYEPYKDTARLASQLQAQGTENIFSGISQVGGAIAGGSQAGLYGAGSLAGGGSGSAATQYSPDQQVSQMNAGLDSQLGASMGVPNLRSTDASGFDRQQLINDSLRGMENSPYRDLIERRLQQDYGIINPGTVG
ncbi:hypothetical protein PV783_34170 [Chitinophaga sp. CC14]|uniref:hypothetical protein n=1 Tax=Chitinophaga sp. CC14 TaxID=3029199 RepID=UPI003B7A2195